jgi:hypothetical protein
MQSEASIKLHSITSSPFERPESGNLIISERRAYHAATQPSSHRFDQPDRSLRTAARPMAAPLQSDGAALIAERLTTLLAKRRYKRGNLPSTARSGS